MKKLVKKANLKSIQTYNELFMLCDCACLHDVAVDAKAQSNCMRMDITKL